MKKDNYYLGILGYSNQAFDEEKVREILTEKIKEALDNLDEERQLHIVSGLTDLGIPRLAYEVAESLGVKTGGIAPYEATAFRIHRCNWFLITGENFGDESECFIEMCDSFLRIGGGNQTEREVRRIKELNKHIIEVTL